MVAFDFIFLKIYMCLLGRAKVRVEKSFFLKFKNGYWEIIIVK